MLREFTRGVAILGVGALLALVLVQLEPVVAPAPAAGPQSSSRGIRARAAMPFQYSGKARPVRAAGAGWEGERPWSAWVDWEPVVAAEPAGERVYQMAVRFYADVCEGCPDPIIVLRASDDGGHTWGPDTFPFRHGRSHADPQLVVTVEGVLIAAFLQDYRPGVVVSRSEDGGRTWSVPTPVTGDLRPRWSDHPYLFASPSGDDVYVALNASDSWVVASHDGGRSFESPVRTSIDGRYWFHTGGTVLPDGTALVAAVDYSQTYRGRADINVLRSEDGGATWSSRRVDRSEEAPACPEVPGCYLGFLGPRAAIAVDEEGFLMLVYNAGETPGGPQRLWYRTSRDGRTWSERRPVVRGPRRIQHAFPLVLAGNDPGEFHVLWQDDRRGVWNTWQRRARAGGDSWAGRVRLSTAGPPAPYKSRRGYRFPYGDYFGASRDGSGRLHAIWGAGESWNGSGGAWYTRSDPQ